VLTIRSTNEIVTFTLDSNGVAGSRQSFASAGLVPFGFKIDRAGHVIVSEAASGLSAYQLAADGSFQVINGPVSTTQAAPCWVLISKDGRYAFTANAGSASISSVSIAKDGTIALVQPVAGTTDGGPLDMALSVDGRFLYTVSRATGVVTSFAVNADGSLTQIDGDGGLPIGAVFGLAAR
jgi:6-phosphogluconolactonase (cycloisomerase 2 family)